MRTNEDGSNTGAAAPTPRPQVRAPLGNWLRAALGVALVSAAGGCGVGVLDASSYLTWVRPAPPAGSVGRVSVLLPRNARPPKQGGDNPRSVGNVRAQAGIPYPVTTETDDELIGAVARLVSDGAQGAGVGLVGPGDTTPATALVQTNVTELWCDGYFGYKSNMTLTVQVLDPRTRAPRTELSLRSSGGGDSCGPAVQEALQKMLDELTRAFSTPVARAALAGPVATAPAPAPLPPPAGGGCTSNTECKRGRTCQQGRCTDPAR